MTTISTAVTVTTASPLRAIKTEVYRLMGISPTAKRPSKAVKDVYGCDLRYRKNWESILVLEQDKGLGKTLNTVRDTLENKLDTDSDDYGTIQAELNTRSHIQPPSQSSIELATDEPNDLDLNQFAITVTSDSQHVVKWHDQVIGMIQCLDGSQWAYVRYSQYPDTFKGSYFECCEKARQDFENLHEPLHSVINTDYFPLANWHWIYHPNTHVVINGEHFGSRSDVDDSINV